MILAFVTITGNKKSGRVSDFCDLPMFTLPVPVHQLTPAPLHIKTPEGAVSWVHPLRGYRIQTEMTEGLRTNLPKLGALSIRYELIW